MFNRWFFNPSYGKCDTRYCTQPTAQMFGSCFFSTPSMSAARIRKKKKVWIIEPFGLPVLHCNWLFFISCIIITMLHLWRRKTNNWIINKIVKKKNWKQNNNRQLPRSTSWLVLDGSFRFKEALSVETLRAMHYYLLLFIIKMLQ